MPLLTDAERMGVRPDLLDVIEYRKSGLSANWIIGCPLQCAYCVRHLFDNFGMRAPRALMREADAAELLVHLPHPGVGGGAEQFDQRLHRRLVLCSHQALGGAEANHSAPPTTRNGTLGSPGTSASRAMQLPATRSCCS